MRHHIFKFLAVAFASLAVLSGCHTVENDTPGPKEIQFTASIGKFDVKATDTAFEDGDQLSLYASWPVSISNVMLTARGKALIPEWPVYWSASQLIDEPTMFYACYPYDYTNDDSFYDRYFTVQEDQSTIEGYTASDLMTAAVSATPAEGSVNLRFAHRLTKLLINIDNRLGVGIEQVYLANVYLEVSYDFPANNSLRVQGNPWSIAARKMEALDQQEVWALILPPQNSSVVLVLKTSEGDYLYYDTDYSVFFSPARCYNAHIIVDQSSIAMDFTSDVMDWLDGDDIPFYQEHPDSGNGESN